MSENDINIIFNEATDLTLELTDFNVIEECSDVNSEIVIELSINNTDVSVDLSEDGSFEADFDKTQVVGSTSDYNDLYNKPSIDDITLKGNHKIEDFNVKSLSNSEIEGVLPF